MVRAVMMAMGISRARCTRAAVAAAHRSDAEMKPDRLTVTLKQETGPDNVETSGQIISSEPKLTCNIRIDSRRSCEIRWLPTTSIDANRKSQSPEKKRRGYHKYNSSS